MDLPLTNSVATIIDRVFGSMNVIQAKIHLSESQKSAFDVSSLFNESPMSYLNYNRPNNIFQELHFTDQGSSETEQLKDNVVCIDGYRLPKTKF